MLYFQGFGKAYQGKRKLFSFVVYIYNTSLQEGVQKIIFLHKLDYINCLHICHNKYSVWALALKAIRL